MVHDLWHLSILSLLIFNVWTDIKESSYSGRDTVTCKTDTLDEIVVTARKRLLKYSANKFEYNIADDSTLVNANLLQAMKRIPILEVGADNHVSSMDKLPQ